ncbi:class I SAM-dependent methyltransferase [Paenibacillus naphthalenovorans]|uniref:class I SAM-dependent methyltransferase n=1 Tax=Paenibacillus naphthalenovorans TaxID=162209 RepID=UPI000887A0BA|nr:class I SAM-dependent methyltransferase [Paenibacillus naphthalenovorans]SDJ78539.1 Methyltransferase domain-containing protein [Paenibacillus naphthalenovorans]
MSTDNRTTFNEVAELYDRARNRYPDRLFDELVRLAGLPAEARIVEIGCGTGIATLPLAERGYSIVGVELGPRMAEVARRKLARFARVEIRTAAYEDWLPPEEPFDLALSATAFHWIDPQVKFSKTARVLKDGGYLAVVKYHHAAGGDESFFERVQSCYERYMPGTGNFRLPQPEELLSDTAPFEASGLFERPVVRTWETIETYTRQTYCELLSTYSNHIALDAASRTQLLDGIGGIIDREYGGQVRKRYIHELIIARKAD